jgi:hypothetical protein
MCIEIIGAVCVKEREHKINSVCKRRGNLTSSRCYKGVLVDGRMTVDGMP